MKKGEAQLATKQEMLAKLREADQAGIDVSSPKAVITHMLARGDKDAVLWFYKKEASNSISILTASLWQN